MEKKKPKSPPKASLPAKPLSIAKAIVTSQKSDVPLPIAESAPVEPSLEPVSPTSPPIGKMSSPNSDLCSKSVEESTVAPEIAIPLSDPVTTQAETDAASAASKLVSKEPADETITETTPETTDLPAGTPSWSSLVKGTAKQLCKKREAFTLPSGEACVTRDISVSKMEGNAFLFRIPNAFTRNRVINQRLWQIEGQTMFVAKWEPGVIPVKPELSKAPIWLELRKVPFQFFNDEALGEIAGMVGDPKFLHPSTAKKTNLEVAKVFTIIDPRKPLPEAVNVQFESGVINRILVSSPWMPPVCGHYKEIGHNTKRCPKSPITCKICSSSSHDLSSCPKSKQGVNAGKKTRRGRSKSRVWTEVSDKRKGIDTTSDIQIAEVSNSDLGKGKDFNVGESSIEKVTPPLMPTTVMKQKGIVITSEVISEPEEDSSDVLSSDSEEVGFNDDDEEEGQIVEKSQTNKTPPKKKIVGLSGARGKGPKSH
ncbi:uncharacterized protein LOC112085142 [Eutrema salsugineum]|uniref:uncharacterized protein LOC112085142 n=1 Tax=Eutrema salsugineum TaxID=72664 RepID=UPI000CED48B8|nr:uncharacterized protein LOC112085142 [Eutrema salsugineum]